MKPWSKLQKRLYGIIDPRIDFQIHCVAYAMKSGKGSAALPRYYITLGKEIIWDYPKDFMEDASPGEVTLKNYPHENDASAISLLIEEYIETDKTILFHKEFISDRWGLTDILKSADRRIGRKRLQSLLKRVRGIRAKEIIYQRNELYEGMKDSSFPEYFARWLETNPPMKRKLIPLKRGKKDLDYKYEGIIPELFVSPHDSGLSIMAYYKNEYWDCIADFDVFVRLDVEKGYYCDFCTHNPDMQYYKTREELFLHHCIEEFLEWSDRRILDSNFLLCWALPGKAWGAQILSPDQLAKYDWLNVTDWVVALLAFKEYSAGRE